MFVGNASYSTFGIMSGTSVGKQITWVRNAGSAFAEMTKKEGNRILMENYLKAFISRHWFLIVGNWFNLSIYEQV